jgi:hypothetical protein
MLKFMGNIFGQAKKIDSDVVERSNDLRPIHLDVQNAFERELRAPRPGPVIIPPTPQEIAATGVVPPPLPPGYMPGTLPTAQPAVEVVPQQQVAQPPVQYEEYIPPTIPGVIVTEQPNNVAPRTGYHHFTPHPQDSNIEVLRLLNTILDKLKIIELQNGQTTPRKPKSTRTVPRRSTKD